MSKPSLEEVSEKDLHELSEPQFDDLGFTGVEMSSAMGEISEKSPGEFLTIGALAKLCGVTVRTLRYYEEMDLIGPVKRTAGKYRLYNEQSLKRVKAILALQDLNYSLDEILSALGSYSKSRSYTKEERIAFTRQSLSQQEAYINEKLEKMAALKQEIEERLKILNSACSPCNHSTPEQSCHEDCQFLSVHN